MGVPNISLFSSLLGEDSQFDEHIFQMGWNHQPDGFFPTRFERREDSESFCFMGFETSKAAEMAVQDLDQSMIAQHKPGWTVEEDAEL